MNNMLRISPGVCILWGLMLLLLPVQWVAACLFAAGFHELCHAGAVKLCGGRVSALEIGADGARMQANAMGVGCSLFCTLAGPLGGLLLTLTVRWFPRLALCAFVQSIYNLLPIMPLDGGRLLQIILEQLTFRQRAEKISHWIGIAISVIILLAGLAAFVLKLGLMPLFFGILLVWQTALRKIPCKPGLRRVQ